MATHDVPVLVGGKLLPSVIDVETLDDGATKKLMTEAERTKLGNIDPANLALDTSVVHKSGAETVAGAKTFSSQPVVPTPTADGSAANKQYVDQAQTAATTAGVGAAAGLAIVFGA